MEYEHNNKREADRRAFGDAAGGSKMLKPTRYVPGLRIPLDFPKLQAMESSRPIDNILK